LFGNGGNPVSKANGELKHHHLAKGYRDLATAYETKGDTAQAITALQSYLGVKKKDANAWGELGGLQLTQAQSYVTQYQQAQQAAQIADPSQPFQPGGTLAQAIGTNAAYQGAAQQATNQTSLLFQQATTALTAAVNANKKVTEARAPQFHGVAAARDNGRERRQRQSRDRSLAPLPEALPELPAAHPDPGADQAGREGSDAGECEHHHGECEHQHGEREHR